MSVTDEGDYNEQTYTVKLFWPNTSAPDLFRGCTEVDRDDNAVTFTDASGKEHQCAGVTYEILEE